MMAVFLVSWVRFGMHGRASNEEKFVNWSRLKSCRPVSTDQNIGNGDRKQTQSGIADDINLRRKFEARNPKQIQIRNDRNSKQTRGACPFLSIRNTLAE